jgi:hypothetical protein
LVTLSVFVGHIVKDLFSALNNVTGHITNMQCHLFLQHICPALPPRVAVLPNFLKSGSLKKSGLGCWSKPPSLNIPPLARKQTLKVEVNNVSPHHLRLTERAWVWARKLSLPDLRSTKSSPVNNLFGRLYSGGTG